MINRITLILVLFLSFSSQAGHSPKYVSYLEKEDLDGLGIHNPDEIVDNHHCNLWGSDKDSDRYYSVVEAINVVQKEDIKNTKLGPIHGIACRPQTVIEDIQHSQNADIEMKMVSTVCLGNDLKFHVILKSKKLFPITGQMRIDLFRDRKSRAILGSVDPNAQTFKIDGKSYSHLYFDCEGMAY